MTVHPLIGAAALSVVLLATASIAKAQDDVPDNVSIVTVRSTKLIPPSDTATCPVGAQAGQDWPAFSMFELVGLGFGKVRVTHYLTGADGFLCLEDAVLVPESTSELGARIYALKNATLPVPVKERLLARTLRVGDPRQHVGMACGQILSETEEETSEGVSSVAHCVDQTVTLKAGRVTKVVRKKQIWER